MISENVEPLLRMRNISKSFGTVEALSNVDFEIYPGEVVGLLGDNGAGKTTLIKIALGLEAPTKGEIYLDGKLSRIRSAHQSREWGMEAAYQGFALVPSMDIMRNFFLGREMLKKVGPFRFLDMKSMNRICNEKLADIGIRRKLSPASKIDYLSGGEKQSICIGRAVSFGMKVLVLDEPTAALSINETQKVLEYVTNAKKMGLAVVFITHNIFHVYSVADRFVILGEGKKIADLKKEKTSIEHITDIISKGKLLAEERIGD